MANFYKVNLNENRISPIVGTDKKQARKAKSMPVLLYVLFLTAERDAVHHHLTV